MGGFEGRRGNGDVMWLYYSLKSKRNILKFAFYKVEDLAQWQCNCLASTRLWVWSLAPTKQMPLIYHIRWWTHYGISMHAQHLTLPLVPPPFLLLPFLFQTVLPLLLWHIFKNTFTFYRQYPLIVHKSNQIYYNETTLSNKEWKLPCRLKATFFEQQGHWRTPLPLHILL